MMKSRDKKTQMASEWNNIAPYKDRTGRSFKDGGVVLKNKEVLVVGWSAYQMGFQLWRGY